MKDHVSPSQIATFRRCPQLWAYTSLEGIRIPPAGAQHLGRSFHAAAEAHHRRKVEDRVGLPTDEIEDRYSQAWRDTLGAEIRWDEEPEKVYDDGARITRLFAHTAAREVQPVVVEHEVRFDVSVLSGSPSGKEALDGEPVRAGASDTPNPSLPSPPPRDLSEATSRVPDTTAEEGAPARTIVLCRLDLVDEGDAVRDLKSASKAPNAEAARNSDQLTAYAAAHRASFGHPPSGVVLDYFVRPTLLFPKGRRLPILGRRVESQVRAWARDVLAVVSQMRQAERTGLFPYAAADSWECSSKWCAFYDRGCPGGADRHGFAFD